MAKNKRGRKPWKPTAEIISDVEKMSAMGLTQDQIAYNIGINPDTLYVYKNKNTEISEAIKRGRAKGTRYVTSQLMKNIEAGNFHAQKYWLTVHAGWKEIQVTEFTGKDGNPVEHKISINSTEDELNSRIAELLGD
jgi:hypothetical protein